MTSADIVHEFQAYSHLGEKGGGGAQSVTCVFFFGDGGGANAYFQRNLKNL